MFDPRTLSLTVGLGNLLFLLLVSLYLAYSKTRHPALEIWRWAKGVQAAGFLTSVAASLSLALPPMLGSLLHIIGSCLELAAYALLLGLPRWRKAILFYAASASLLLLGVSWNEVVQTPRLILVSFATAIPLAVISALLLRAASRNGLMVVVALVNGAFAAILASRGIHGLMGAELVRFAPTVLNFSIYLMAYVTIVVNGFGFLLFMKQQDDRLIAQQIDSLRDAASAQRQLLALASHEFRTPAAIIKSSLDSLRFVSEPIPASLAVRLEQISAASGRLLKLTNTVISEDRLRHRDLTPRLAEHNLNDLIAEVCAAYPPSAPIMFIPTTDTSIILADAELLRIALHNLIDNALAHNPEQDASVEITVQARGDKVDILVRDNGPGIPDDCKPHLFEPHRTAKGGLAKGLGLSLTRHLLRVQHGEVNHTDNTPRGSVFIVQLIAGARTG